MWQIKKPWTLISTTDSAFTLTPLQLTDLTRHLEENTCNYTLINLLKKSGFFTWWPVRWTFNKKCCCNPALQNWEGSYKSSKPAYTDFTPSSARNQTISYYLSNNTFCERKKDWVDIESVYFEATEDSTETTPCWSHRKHTYALFKSPNSIWNISYQQRYFDVFAWGGNIATVEGCKKHSC